MMTTCKILAAAVVVIYFPDVEAKRVSVPYDLWSPAIRNFATRCELMDERETIAFLADRDSFVDDIRWLHYRYWELYDAPCLDDVERLPTRETIDQMIAFNRSYHEQLVRRYWTDQIHRNEVEEVLLANDKLYQVLDCMRTARSKYQYVYDRRQALQRLRDLIGVEAYSIGQWPACVPVVVVRDN